ncbi:MAG: M50 family metallopeptidase [Candidatus Omnitrophica bacterium]|jgi:hypothetical protein|nr:M50 family metallopeptidase [Candidatus Omnitrophota bacterium]
MLTRILKISLGVLALPVCFGVSLSLYRHVATLSIFSLYQQKYFLFGIIAYFVFHALVIKPLYPFVLSHELTHAIAALLTGAKVRSIQISSKGGSVSVSKNNVFIALSPYFVPLYTIIIILLWFAAERVLGSGPYQGWFLFAAGFTLAFHIVLTVDFLKTRQTDLQYAGYPLSACLIYIINLVVVGFVLSFLFQGLVFSNFLKDSYMISADAYKEIFKQLFL